MASLEKSSITQPGSSEGYAFHNEWDNSRNYEVLGALGLSSIAAPENYIQETAHEKSIYRRKIPSLQGYPTNSTIADVAIPYFSIEGGLHWLTSEEDAGSDLQVLKDTVGDGDYAALNMTKPWNPCT